MLEQLREEFELLKASPPQNLNVVEHLWENIYTEYRQEGDPTRAFSWLSLLLEVSEYSYQRGHSFGNRFRQLIHRLNFIHRFGVSERPGLWGEIIDWLRTFLSEYNLEEAQTKAQKWRNLEISEVNRLVYLRNVLAVVRSDPLASELTRELPELANWLGADISLGSSLA